MLLYNTPTVAAVWKIVTQKALVLVVMWTNPLCHFLYCTAQGIPIVYYGTEQGYSGGNDPANRESLWPNYNVNYIIFKVPHHTAYLTVSCVSRDLT